METIRKIGVIGHKNPDTDSICSAIAYANLKNELGGGVYEPLRASNINGETDYVLRRFGLGIPELCLDVGAQVQDIDIRRMPGVSGMMTVRKAWETMRDQQISTLPITEKTGCLQGTFTSEGPGHGQLWILWTPSFWPAPTPPIRTSWKLWRAH